MTLGTLNHLSLTVVDRDRSEPFYDAILRFMNYEQVERTEDYTMWWSPPAGAILIGSAKPESRDKPHDRYAPGLHHLAFNAASRQQVDDCYQLLQTIGATILDPPAEYPQYAPNYYAVFFADPDGLKLELVHMPHVP